MSIIQRDCPIIRGATRGTLLPVLFVSLTLACAAQKTANETRIYDPSADAAAALNEALRVADASGRHVLVQVGGNWCSWCLKLEKLFAGNDTIARILNEHYVFLRVNYSKENKNLRVLERLEFPQRFGFPVLVVLDAKGRRLHTQDSGLLEEGGQHSAEKVRTFLSKWTSTSLDPAPYRE